MRSCPLALLLVLGLLAAPALLGFQAAPASGDEVPKPLKAYNAFMKEKRGLDEAEIKQRAEAYLEAWAGTGQKATGANRYGLAQWQQAAERYKEAAAGFRAVSQDTEVKPRTQDYAASAEAGVLLIAEARQAVGATAVEEAVKRLAGYADGMSGDAQQKTRTKLRTALARLLELAGRPDAATDMRMEVITSDVSKLPGLLRPVIWGLRGSTHSMGGYDKMRKRAADVMKTLRGLQSKKAGQAKSKLEMMREKLRAIMPEAVGDDGRLVKDNPREMTKAERAVYSAQRSYDSAVEVMASIAGYEKTFALLGSAAPAVTVDKAYGDVEKLEDLKGKVVVLDFWITSGQRSNFGVMRDLMRDYAQKGMTVLGITATSHVCYETRFDIDEDHADKVRPGQRKQYAARLASEMDPPDEGNAIYPEDRYMELEMKVVGRFVEQHELKWPHMMILETEPEDHFALEGWPHLVVLDKQGRIRYIQPATLTRDKKEEAAALRKVVDDLLKE